MRIFRDKGFSRFARRENIADSDLCEAVARAESGLIDADLGGGVIKQRVARPGAGRSGGFRTILFFRAGERTFFVFGYAKSDRDNISASDLRILKETARQTLALTDDELDVLVKAQVLTEVDCDGKESGGEDVQK